MAGFQGITDETVLGWDAGKGGWVRKTPLCTSRMHLEQEHMQNHMRQAGRPGRSHGDRGAWRRRKQFGNPFPLKTLPFQDSPTFHGVDWDQFPSLPLTDSEHSMDLGVSSGSSFHFFFLSVNKINASLHTLECPATCVSSSKALIQQLA